MSNRFHFKNEMPTSISTEEDLVDDSMDVIPMTGLCTPQSLKSRFIKRLERLLYLKLRIEEDTIQHSITITFTGDKEAKKGRLDAEENVRSFLKAIEDLLNRIAKGPGGQACEQLWDELLIYIYETSKSTIKNMQQTFKTNQGPYDDLVTRMFGINDVDAGSSTVDCELGNQLISLHQMVGAYSNSMKETNALVNFASQMTRVIMHLQDRLRGLLGRARFASEMYRLICELGFPERVYSTLVRAAASSKTFEKITFQLPPSIPPKRVSSMSSAKSPSSTRKPVPQQKFILTPVPSTSLLNRKATTSASPTGHGDNTILQSGKFPTVPPKPPSLITASSSPPLQEKSNLLKRSDSACITVTVNTDDPLEAARPYLSHSDHTLSILCLKPASKRITVQLIATILRGTILPVNSEAWYQFGFATTQDEGEERHLAGLYMAILKEAQDPKAIFSELVNAIEENSVVRLFDMNNYSHFRQAFPHLQVFLNTPPAKRPTVWRLNQFVKSDQAVEPPACLQRDYGFKYCRRRDEVERMKAIYDIMLRQVGPMKLHSFCMVNRLYEEGIIKTGIPMKSGDARLMQNDYMTPFVGFDNDLGLAAYRGPFFKRPLKV